MLKSRILVEGSYARTRKHIETHTPMDNEAFVPKGSLVRIGPYNGRSYLCTAKYCDVDIALYLTANELDTGRGIRRLFNGLVDLVRG